MSRTLANQFSRAAVALMLFCGSAWPAFAADPAETFVSQNIQKCRAPFELVLPEVWF
jgi:hypothetical protein